MLRGVIVTRKQFAALIGVNPKTVARRFEPHEWIGPPADRPLDKIQVHHLPGRGRDHFGYDLAEALALVERLEAASPSFRTSNRWQAARPAKAWDVTPPPQE
jgi:hypothetical protein